MSQKYVFILYNVPGPRIWHERLVLARPRPGAIVGRTPDAATYEELLVDPENVLDFCLGNNDHTLPRQLEGAQVHRFNPALTAEQEASYINAVAFLYGTPAPAALAGAAASAAVAAVVDAEVWVASEDRHGMKRGEVVEVPAERLLSEGDRGIVRTALGPVHVVRITKSQVATYAQRDIRILPIRFDQKGVRGAPFGEVVSLLTDDVPEGGGLQLKGNATVMWFAQHCKSVAHTPVGFHETWLRDSSIASSDRSGYEHEVICRVLEAAIAVDFLNVGALKSMELLVRRATLIREAHRASPGSPDYTHADVYMGWERRKTALAPAYQQYIVDELKAENAFAKEARKAREADEDKKKNNNNNRRNHGKGDGKGGGQNPQSQQ
jgi:hypothetical protein